MMNIFKNAFNLSSGPHSSDDSAIQPTRPDNYILVGKRSRNALARSSSFREEHIPHSDMGRRSLRHSQSQTFDGSSKAIDGPKMKNFNQYKIGSDNRSYSSGNKLPKFNYSRPEFLNLKTDDEILVSADHQIRPILLPRDISRLPWGSGYAECINAGKSQFNEDQAVFYQDVIIQRSSLQLIKNSDNFGLIDETCKLPWVYFGVFDGHAGASVAVAAAAQLHEIIGEKLGQVADLLIALEFASSQDVDELDGAEADDFMECSDKPDEYQVVSNNNSGEGQSNHLDKWSTEESDCDCKSEHGNEKTQGEIKVATLSSENSNSPPQTYDSVVSSMDSTPSSSSSGKSESEARDDPSNQQEESNIAREEPSCKQKPRTWDRLLPSLQDLSRNNRITVEKLVIGALESAFWEMDTLIERDKCNFKMPGGCTAIISLFILGKLYVCNAGDSRAIVCKSKKVLPMSFDFTPISERERILRLGLDRPEFLGNEFTHLEFIRRPTRQDLGSQMLYKDAYMKGWSMKTITYDDLKFPLVWGEGKRSRVLATIGVTRGFGDHELRAQPGSVLIKPFLTPEPEVRVLPLETDDTLTSEDVLIMGTDGLWDVTSNQEAADIVSNSFNLFPDGEATSKFRYISAAQDLIIHSRGQAMSSSNIWRIDDDTIASLDDIAVFVIPLKQYRDEYLEWKKLRTEVELLKKSK